MEPLILSISFLLPMIFRIILGLLKATYTSSGSVRFSMSVKITHFLSSPLNLLTVSNTIAPLIAEFDSVISNLPIRRATLNGWPSKDAPVRTAISSGYTSCFVISSLTIVVIREFRFLELSTSIQSTEIPSGPAESIGFPEYQGFKVW